MTKDFYVFIGIGFFIVGLAPIIYVGSRYLLAWLDDGKYEHSRALGRACEVGLIFGIFSVVFWPVTITAAIAVSFAYLLRYLRRSQKTLGKIIEHAHRHDANGDDVSVEIKQPDWR